MNRIAIRSYLLAVFAAAAVLLVLSPGRSQARIKLVTLPDRDQITMQLSRGETTLVEEQRWLNLQQGRNRIDFAWRNTTINGPSIQLRVIENPPERSTSSTPATLPTKRPSRGMSVAPWMAPSSSGSAT